MADVIGTPGDKQRLTIRVDGVSYGIICEHAKRLGLPTPNHGAFDLVVKGVRQLREQFEWAEEAYHKGMLVDMSHRKEWLADEDKQG
jgi:hypothetical protein